LSPAKGWRQSAALSLRSNAATFQFLDNASRLALSPAYEKLPL